MKTTFLCSSTPWKYTCDPSLPSCRPNYNRILTPKGTTVKITAHRRLFSRKFLQVRCESGLVLRFSQNVDYYPSYPKLHKILKRHGFKYENKRIMRNEGYQTVDEADSATDVKKSATKKKVVEDCDGAPAPVLLSITLETK